MYTDGRACYSSLVIFPQIKILLAIIKGKIVLG